MSETTLVGSMLIVGAIVSFVISLLKARYGSLNAGKSKLLLIVLSIAVGAVYHVLQATNTLPVAMIVLGTASSVYALFIKG